MADMTRYQRSLATIYERWAAKVAEPLKKIEKINDELAKLEAEEKKRPLTDEEEELRKKCLAARKKYKDEVAKADLEKKFDEMLSEPPPANATKSDYEKLSKELEKVVNTIKKGLPVGAGLTIRPDIDVDIRKLKVKKIGLILEWKF